MSFAGFDDAKERVRQAVNIGDVISRYVPLQRQGRNLVGRCPFHDDTRPSLTVNSERQSWRCWVCSIGGDAFSFVMRKEGIGFREALEMLADMAGIALPQGRGPQAEPGSSQDRRTLYQATAWAEDQFHQCLLHAQDAEAARQYLGQRGITQDSIRRYRLGFSPLNYQWMVDRCRSTNFSTQVSDVVGLITRREQSNSYYDRFRGRVIFPIRDVRGRPIAFGGRILPGQDHPSKYVNSPETPLFRKSDHLYGLDVVRDVVTRSRCITVMEGYTDVIIAIQHGVPDAVAVLGVALGPAHLKLLKQYVERITLVLDGDAAGQRRAGELLDLFMAEPFDVRILTLPDNLDPCDYLLSRGAEEFQSLAQAAPDALEHKLRLETRDLDIALDTHRANRALENILRTMSAAPANQQVSALRLREQQMLSRLARQFLIPEQQLVWRLDSLREERKNAVRPSKAAAAPQQALSVAHDLHARDVELLEILSVAPELIDVISQSIDEQFILPGAALTIYQYYVQIWRATGSVEFQQVLAEIEDADIKSVLVEIDERAQQKAERTESSPRDRLTMILAGYEQLQNELHRRRLMQELDAANSDEASLRVLQQKLDLARQSRRI